jgi:hypothetical protein
MVTEKMLALLDALGANQPSGRSGRTLGDHLEGTRALLDAWDSPTDICLAGLFHSAYGAEGGAARARDANLARREEIRSLIGDTAEHLAYLYSALERRHLFENAAQGRHVVHDLFTKAEVPVSETTLRALFEIEAANFVEGPLSRFAAYDDAFLARVEALWQSAQHFVTAPAYAAVVARFRAIADARGRQP